MDNNPQPKIEHKTKLPPNILRWVRHAEQNGHRMYSQGCAIFRCYLCELVGYLDNDAERKFFERCPKRSVSFIPSQFY